MPSGVAVKDPVVGTEHNPVTDPTLTVGYMSYVIVPLAVAPASAPVVGSETVPDTVPQVAVG
jgi:hypothetical protein